MTTIFAHCMARIPHIMSAAALVAAASACDSAPWDKTKPAAPGSTASDPISADGSPVSSPVAGAPAKPAQRVIPMGPFPAPWQGLWRGTGTDHMTDGRVVPFSMELKVASNPDPESPGADRWVWAMSTRADVMAASPYGELLSVDRASGKWRLSVGRQSADAWFARGTLSVHMASSDMRESTIYTYGTEGDREFIDIERSIETPREVASSTPLGTSGLHPGAVLRARLWRVDVTPEETAQGR
jgi:hypothetical protein